MNAQNNLVVPSFYDDANAQWGYRPNTRDVFLKANQYQHEYDIKPSMTDRKSVHLLIIDGQRDFVFPEGTLYVGGRSGTGATDDIRRTAKMIYSNLDTITKITPTMDTHFPFQIFFPAFWVDSNGTFPEPHTIIEVEDIRSGKYQPNPAVAGWLANGNYPWLLKQVEYYCAELARKGKYTLYLWPEHCLLGDDGHVLAGVFQEARMFHAYVRGIQSKIEVKGGNPLTENYSVLGPEVTTRFDGKPLAQKNARFVKTLLNDDYIVIGGQAGSHCVASSTDDLLEEINAQDPELAQKVYVATDLMSAVTVPDGNGGFHMDFTPQMEAAFARWEDAGMKLVKSTDPIREWPGIDL